jgi:DNA-binding XRE family transcriptional regulator
MMSSREGRLEPPWFLTVPIGVDVLEPPEPVGRRRCGRLDRVGRPLALSTLGVVLADDLRGVLPVVVAELASQLGGVAAAVVDQAPEFAPVVEVADVVDLHADESCRAGMLPWLAFVENLQRTDEPGQRTRCPSLTERARVTVLLPTASPKRLPAGAVDRYRSVAPSVEDCGRSNTYSDAMGLRDIRADQVLSQQDLASRAGISKTTIVGIEAGRITHPHPATVRKLAAALSMEPREVLRQIQPAGGAQ